MPRRKKFSAKDLYMLEDEAPPAAKPDEKPKELTANDLVGKRHRRKKPKLKL
jgi:hypothetical protein